MSVSAATGIASGRVYLIISPNYFHRPGRLAEQHCDAEALSALQGERAEPERGFRYGIEPLRRHLAHKVALANLDTETAQDVVGRRRMEIEVRHREVEEVILGAEFALLAALGERHLRVLSPIELVGLQAFEEI